jgi:hypothetical protein
MTEKFQTNSRVAIGGTAEINYFEIILEFSDSFFGSLSAPIQDFYLNNYQLINFSPEFWFKSQIS